MKILTVEKLLHSLDEVYPNKLPMKADVTKEELRFKQGQRSVVVYIQALVEADEEDSYVSG